MNIINEKSTTERTSVIVPVREIMDRNQSETFTAKYYISDKEFNRLNLEIIAEVITTEGDRRLEIWYGLNNYDRRFFAFGTSGKHCDAMSVEDCIAVAFNDYVDWDELFGGMNA